MIDAGVDTALVAFEADSAPFQPTVQKAVVQVNTFQFTNYNDNVANNSLLGSRFGQTEGASVFNVNYNASVGHSINDFANQIYSLPTGNYKVEDVQIYLINPKNC